MTHTIPQINLVPVRIRQQRHHRTLIARWFGVVCVASVIVGIPGVYLGGNAALSDPMMGAQIERVRGQLSANQSEIPRLQARIGVLEEKRKTLDLVRNRIDWQELFAQVVSASDHQIHFTGIQASGGGIEGTNPIHVNMVGIATTQTEARSFVVNLEALGLFDHVELIRTNRQDLQDQEIIEFQIQAYIGDSNGGRP
jgi:Tfp pilus assembly protein PilN